MENEKRTAERNAGEDEEDDEKMEEFFALIRNFKDLRNQLNDQTEKGNSKRKRKSDSDSDHHRKSATAWVPAFQWEDFTTEIEFRRPSSVLPSPCNYRNEIIKKDDEVNGSSGLDLKLSL